MKFWRKNRFSFFLLIGACHQKYNTLTSRASTAIHNIRMILLQFISNFLKTDCIQLFHRYFRSQISFEIKFLYCYIPVIDALITYNILFAYSILFTRSISPTELVINVHFNNAIVLYLKRYMYT